MVQRSEMIKRPFFYDSEMFDVKGHSNFETNSRLLKYKIMKIHVEMINIMVDILGIIINYF